MTVPPRASRLARAIAPPAESPPGLELRQGIVRAISKASSPYVVTVDLSGVSHAGICYLAWWEPEVGAVVQVLKQGPSLFVLGPVAPANVVVPAHDHAATIDPAPAPPPPPAEPTPTPAPRTATVTANASRSWQPPYGWRSGDDLYQGGGSAQRGFWFYGSKIADAKGAGSIVAATIFVKRLDNHGVNGSANVRLGTHGHTAEPTDGSGALSNVAKVGTLGRGKGATFNLTAGQIAALNAGAAGVGLEPGALGYTSVDYLIAAGRSDGDWSGVLTLTVQD